MSRLTTRELFRDLLSKLVQVDRGFLYTSKRLFTGPGRMVKEYLEGKRVLYTKPFSYLLLSSAISLLLFPKKEFEQGMRDGMREGQTRQTSGKIPKEEIDATMHWLMEFFTNNMSLLLVLMVPILALFSRWWFRKKGINFAEHLVGNMYLVSMANLLCIPLFLGFYSDGITPLALAMTSIMYVVYVLVLGWGYTQWLNLRIWKGMLAGLAIYVISYLLYALFLGLVTSIGIGMYFKWKYG